MKRRNFVRQSSLFGIASLFTIPMVGIGSTRLKGTRGFKNLAQLSNLKEISSLHRFEKYITALKQNGFTQIADNGYSYNSNVLLHAEKSGSIFPKKGILFVTSSLTGFDHLFIEEKHLGELDEMIYSFTEGVKENGKFVDAADYLLPNKVLKKNNSEIRYANKFGDEFSIKRINKKTKIFIS